MNQETTTWGWRQLRPALSTSMRIYLLFLVVTSVLTAVRLARAWRASPEFAAGGQPHLCSVATSIRHQPEALGRLSVYRLVHCTSTSRYELCVKMLDENRVASIAIQFAVLGFSSTLTMT